METLPRGYGPAAEEPTERDELPCTCGHSSEDHIDPPEGLAGEYRAILEKVVVAVGNMSRRNTTDELYDIYQESIGALSLCQHKGCMCRKYEPLDPRDR